MLAAARATGKAVELTVRLSGNAAPVVISATPFRGERDMLLLLRISSAEEPGGTSSTSMSPVQSESPDAVVITDSSGRVKMSNPAFLELIGAGGEAQIKGQQLSRWVAGFDQQLDGVLDVINRHGIATRATSVLRQGDEAIVEVELSAALLTGGEQLHIGISLRRRAIESSLTPAKRHDLSDQISALATSFGHLSLDQLLTRVAELAEQQFVQQALDQSGGDKGAAARLLGVTTARIRKQSGWPADVGRDDSDPTLH
jgi:transcriptional regulator with PAS, ATPase and Fis domain